MKRVAIADNHSKIRAALRLLLSKSEEIEIVHEASNGQEAVDCVKRFQPDILVMDTQMTGLDGFAATRIIVNLSLSTQVVLISTYGGSFFAKQAADIGAKGFIPKDKLVNSLLLAIEAVHRGELYFQE